jgi:23S rRNA (uracil-5-)-methyltransferase RumA
MQDVPYEEQLHRKSAELERLFGRDFIDQIHPSPREHAYRNKMEFTFGDEFKDGPLALGMHKKRSFYDIVTVGGCRLVDEDFRQILLFTRDYFAAGDGAGCFTFYHRRRHAGYLRHLLVRKAARTGEILLALVTTSQEEHDLAPWLAGVKELPLTGIVNGVLHIVNDGVADTVQADEVRLLYGRDYFYEEALGLSFKITPFSFFQTNSWGAEVLYGLVRDFVGKAGLEKPVIYDLYCGTGTIAQILAPLAERVVGVDIVPEAIAAARENAVHNGLHNCEFVSGDVLAVLGGAGVMRGAARNAGHPPLQDETVAKPDLVVLDPPRAGLHPKALPKILALAAPHLVYVSCQPTSLARDLAALREGGYAATRATAVDMFPHTPNVEVVVGLKLCQPTEGRV